MSVEDLDRRGIFSERRGRRRTVRTREDKEEKVKDKEGIFSGRRRTVRTREDKNEKVKDQEGIFSGRRRTARTREREDKEEVKLIRASSRV